MTNKLIGKQGENLAADFLTNQGYTILEKNFKYSRFAEIDIIAKKNDTIHFVEVKTRSSNAFGSPFEAVDTKKLASIFTCAQYYLKTCKIKYKSFQIDAVGIILKKGAEPEITVLENLSL